MKVIFDKMNGSIKKSVVLILTLTLALSGCSGIRIRELGPGNQLVTAENEALVTGKVVFVENGEEVLPYDFRRKTYVTLFQIESGKKALSLPVENDGSFYWIIPRGTYIVSVINQTDLMYGSSGNYVVQPKVVFQVPYGADALYLGALVVDVQVGRHLFGERYLQKINSISVRDRFDEAKGTIEARNLDLGGRIVKNLMIHDSSIPVDPDLQSKKALIDIIGIIGLGLIMQYNIQHYP